MVRTRGIGELLRRQFSKPEVMMSGSRGVLAILAIRGVRHPVPYPSRAQPLAPLPAIAFPKLPVELTHERGAAICPRGGPEGHHPQAGFNHQRHGAALDLTVPNSKENDDGTALSADR